VEDGRLLAEGEGDPGDWWRVVAAASWRHLDERGEPAEVDALVAPRA
jgi:hypothetical protein